MKTMNKETINQREDWLLLAEYRLKLNHLEQKAKELGREIEQKQATSDSKY